MKSKYKPKGFIMKDLSKDVVTKMKIEKAFEEIEALLRIPVKTQTILQNIEKALGTNMDYEKETKQINAIIDRLRDKAIREVENADV